MNLASSDSSLIKTLTAANELTVDVLIPTYNRSSFVEVQIHALKGLSERLLPLGIRLSPIISDNKSARKVTVPSYLQSFVRVVEPENHLPTAEENLAFGVKHCSGEYLWVLGDDDSIIPHNLERLFIMLKETRYDFVIGNSSGSLVNGQYVHKRTLCSAPDAIESLPDFVQRTGLWFVIAAFSCLVFKREPFVSNLSKFEDYQKVSKIYSHVFYLIDVFWDLSFKYFDLPMVVYKQNRSDMGENHWEKVAAREQVFHGFFWTIGYVNQVKLLRQNRQLPREYFSQIVDQSIDRRHRHLNGAIDAFLDVLDRDFARRKSLARRITEKEKEEFVEFLLNEDSGSLELISLLKQHLARPSRSLLNECRLVMKKYQGANFYRHFYINSVCGWNIYFFDNCYRALPAGAEAYLMTEIRDISPVNSEFQRVAGSLGEITEMVLQNPYPQGFDKRKKFDAGYDREQLVLFILSKVYDKLKMFVPKSLVRRLANF